MSALKEARRTADGNWHREIEEPEVALPQHLELLTRLPEPFQ